MEKPTFREALKFWTKLGFISFGGPAGQVAIMHEFLVEKKKWISDSKFLHALNYCMVLPGPEAQQLATYIGWMLHGTLGGLAAEDLTSLYQKVDGKTKKQILSCIFSEKVHFENGKAATPKYTPPIEVLINARGVLEGSKNKQEVYKDLLCTLAPKPGLEPGTL